VKLPLSVKGGSERRSFEHSYYETPARAIRGISPPEARPLGALAGGSTPIVSTRRPLIDAGFVEPSPGAVLTEGRQCY